jgi:hypothetical protein
MMPAVGSSRVRFELLVSYEVGSTSPSEAASRFLTLNLALKQGV